MISTFEDLLLITWLAAVATVPSVLLQRRGRPTAALAWLFALFALPPVTLFAWWLIGRSHLSRKRRRRQHALEELNQALIAEQRRVARPQSAADRLLSDVSLPPALQQAIFPPSGGNRAVLLEDTRQAFDAWEQSIDQARHHIHMLYYIWRNDTVGRRFLRLLTEKARQGLQVRVLYDGVGSATLPADFFRPLSEAGGHAECFMPIRFFSRRPMINFRNHRKLLIADGRIGYTGGINIGEEYLGWQDLGLLVEGPGVDQLQEIFFDDWYFACREDLTDSGCFGRWQEVTSEPGVSCATVASGPDQRFNATREMLFLAFLHCQRRLWIMTPYLVPDSAFSQALRSAAYRGVDVRIMVPAESDVPLVRRASRAFYPDLTDAGVRIYEYAGMLHAKTLVFDEELLLIGSANMDTRSFRLNFEVSTFLVSRSLNGQVARFFLRHQTRSQRVDTRHLAQRSWSEQVLDAAAHLMSPLL
ncbi:MAG TPA: cardiolipin synthase [Sedimenticola sp.]|nr:cardiolipin synthase [Sedimenticola sp.]